MLTFSWLIGYRLKLHTARYKMIKGKLGGVDMEESIKRMIAVDKQVQAIIAESKKMEASLKDTLQKEKQALKKQYWKEAEQKVEAKKKELSGLIGAADARSQQQHEQAINRLKEAFAKQEAEWQQQIYDRCIGAHK